MAIPPQDGNRLTFFLCRRADRAFFWKRVLELDAMLQRHLHIQEPEDLPISKWALKVVLMHKIRKDEAKRKEVNDAGL